jgi:hypothetical protein
MARSFPKRASQGHGCQKQIKYPKISLNDGEGEKMYNCYNKTIKEGKEQSPLRLVPLLEVVIMIFLNNSVPP